MLGRSGLLALSLLALAGLIVPARAQPEPAAPAAVQPAKPAAARPATKKPAKPPAKSAVATAAPAAPATPLTPEEAERQAYKQRLNDDLLRVQATLAKQQTDLAAEQNRLKQLYSDMMEAVSKADAEPAPAAAPGGAGGASGANAKKEMSPAVKASVSYEAQTYKVQVARQAVLSSQKEVLRLQGFLQRISQ